MEIEETGDNLQVRPAFQLPQAETIVDDDGNEANFSCSTSTASMPLFQKQLRMFPQQHNLLNNEKISQSLINEPGNEESFDCSRRFSDLNIIPTVSEGVLDDHYEKENSHVENESHDTKEHDSVDCFKPNEEPEEESVKSDGTDEFDRRTFFKYNVRRMSCRLSAADFKSSLKPDDCTSYIEMKCDDSNINNILNEVNQSFIRRDSESGAGNWCDFNKIFKK